MANVARVVLPAEADRPTIRVYRRAWLPVDAGAGEGEDNEPRRPGVWLHGLRRTPRGVTELFDRWLCDPLELLGSTTADDPTAWPPAAKVFEFIVGDSVRQWCAPGSLLGGRAEALYSVLMDAGLAIGNKAWPTIVDWLTRQRAPVLGRHVSRSGWTRSGDAFALHGSIIGRSGVEPGEQLIVYSGRPMPPVHYWQRGSAEEWRATVGAAGASNGLIAFALAAALAAPLLALLHLPSGGVHFYGDSSTGKTTLLAIATSVWGLELRTWSATVSGLEVIAALHSDLPLCLDEIGVARPETVADLVYYVLNGVPRARATRGLEEWARPNWRTLLLSSGERPLETYLGEDARAGHLVRIVDIRADTRRYGMLDDTCWWSSAHEAVDQLRRAATEHRGWAGPALLQHVLDHRDQVAVHYSRARDELASVLSSRGGQAARVLDRFAAVAAAGELAVEAAVVPWPAGWATAVARAALAEWVEARAADEDLAVSIAGGPIEATQIVRQVVEWIVRHEGQFSDIDAAEPEDVRERAGWWRQLGPVRHWYVLLGALERAAPRWPRRRVMRALDAAGLIVDRDDLARARKTIRVQGVLHRVIALQIDVGLQAGASSDVGEGAARLPLAH